jgi:hypothetical protein
MKRRVFRHIWCIHNILIEISTVKCSNFFPLFLLYFDFLPTIRNELKLFFSSSQFSLFLISCGEALKKNFINSIYCFYMFFSLFFFFLFSSRNNVFKRTQEKKLKSLYFFFTDLLCVDNQCSWIFFKKVNIVTVTLLNNNLKFFLKEQNERTETEHKK